MMLNWACTVLLLYSNKNCFLSIGVCKHYKYFLNIFTDCCLSIFASIMSRDRLITPKEFFSSPHTHLRSH